MICVAQIDYRPLVVAGATETVCAASQRMLANHVDTVVVVDEAGHPDGVVTERDIVIRCVARESAPTDTALSEVMSSRARTVREGMPVEFALREMADAEVRRLVVVDENGRAIGVLSLDDVMRQIALVSEEVGRLLLDQGHAGAGVWPGFRGQSGARPQGSEPASEGSELAERRRGTL